MSPVLQETNPESGSVSTKHALREGLPRCLREISGTIPGHLAAPRALCYTPSRGMGGATGKGWLMDDAYLKRRVREETLAALKAAHPSARRIHLELARRYRKLVVRPRDETLA